MFSEFIHGHHFVHEFLVDCHEIGNECFQMENMLAALLHSMFVNTGKFDRFCFQ